MSSDELNVSGYSSVNSTNDSLTVILVNRSLTSSKTVIVNISNFSIPNGTYSTKRLSSLPSGETFVSNTVNALSTGTATVASNSLTITLPSLSTTAVILKGVGALGINDVADNTLHAKLFPNPVTPLNHSNPWELYVAVALSAQQTDVGVNKVTETLFQKYKSLEDYKKVSLEEFEQDIRSINFYKGKAKAIKKAADIVSTEYKGKMPETMEELIKLPFVGRKTANVILQEAFGKSEGVVVDTHVKRLSNLFGLSAQKDPVKIEKDLMEIVPKVDWREFGLGLIYYGRTYCKASCKHIDCPLSKYIVK